MARAFALLPFGALALLPATVLAATATFDDLSSAPPFADSTGLFFANGNSASYQGVVWDARFRVVGDEYRVDPASGPLFGLPQSGRYFVTNEPANVGGVFTNDGLMMITPLVLTEAWFGQNEYYGFGGGADQVTVHALSGTTVLGSVTLDLPDNNDGQPEPLRKMNTRAFLSLTGITGYRIDRRAQGEFSDNWVGDNFVFQAPVPEPGTGALAGLGLLMLGAGALARRPRRRP